MEGEGQEVRAVVLGWQKSDKASVINSILGGEVASDKHFVKSVRNDGEANGRKITLINTPCWWENFGLQDSPDVVKQELVCSVFQCPPGPHVFLLVINLSLPFIEENRLSIEKHFSLFGERIWRHTIVLFTRADSLKDKHSDQCMKNPDLKQIIKRCGDKYHIFDFKNRSAGVHELLIKINDVVAENNGEHFETHDDMLLEMKRKRNENEERAKARQKTLQDKRDQLKKMGNAFVREGAVPITTPHPRVPCWMGDRRSVMEFPPGNHSLWAPHSSSTPMPVKPPAESTSLSVMDPLDVSLAPPSEDRMPIAALEGELTFGDDDSAALSPSGSVTLPEADPQLSAMLKRAVEAVELEWNPPPCPGQSRLDDWYLGAGRAGSQPAAPVPFFPVVHGELTRSWMAPFTAGSDLESSSPLTTLDGGAVKVYEAIPPVERSVAAHLCLAAAADWAGDPCFPPQACGCSSVLTDRAYRACGQAASSLHALALLQVFQAKALMDMHKGSLGRALTSELRTATDLALRSTSVVPCVVGLAMCTLVVGLFGDAAESCTQQFSTAHVQSEAIRHILPRRPAAAMTPPPVADPPPARRRGHPTAAASAPSGLQQQSSPRPQHRASRRQAAQPVSVTAKPGGNLVPQLSQEQIPLFLGPKKVRLAVCDPVKPCTPRFLLVSPAGSRVRFEDPIMPSPVTPADQWSQVSVALHTQTSLQAASRPSEPGRCSPPRCPPPDTSVVPLVPLSRFVEAWRELPGRSSWLLRTIRHSYTIQFFRHPPKFSGVLYTSVLTERAPLCVRKVQSYWQRMR
ncbi:unnamed protein product [Leuciscus chuanchicus]